MDINFNSNNLLDQFTEAVYTYGPKLLGGILVWIIGGFIIKLLMGSFTKMLNKRKTDESLKPFLISLAGILLKTMLVISVLGMLGVEMTSFIAVLGAAGLAVGMALSGTLQNFAGGVIILLFKPFKVGDYIDAQGHAGIVKEIQIFNTILLELDNKTVILPNGPLSTGSMVNYSTQPTRRVDFTFGIAYGDNVDKARKVIFDLFKSDKRILKDPAYFVGLSEMADSSVNLTARAWVKGDDYWDVYFDINEKTYNAFNAEGISIPFPQMDVHIQK
ncbi:mechanosensitive ion channel [Lutimonas saemankumensis]|uniref:mechanosensitive ion channel family protein n=1 Tax=Lutimonas saemankumensis TaxID=483016 RepID=UPI001CD7FD10|nr:mechanosensitive ion channel domain-containing protein [Lutimonas saemankumensis]MCA0932339.1 mechanosensitive ion channel [Lutimonas saemankumensis]